MRQVAGQSRPGVGEDRQLWHCRMQVLHLDLACTERRQGGCYGIAGLSLFGPRLAVRRSLIAAVGLRVVAAISRYLQHNVENFAQDFDTNGL